MSDRLGSLKLLFPKLEILVPRRGTVVSLCGNWSFCVWKLEFLYSETQYFNKMRKDNVTMLKIK